MDEAGKQHFSCLQKLNYLKIKGSNYEIIYK